MGNPSDSCHHFGDPDDESEWCESASSDLAIQDETIITAADGVAMVRCAVHMLQLSVHDFFKGNLVAREIISKEQKVAKKTHKQSIKGLFKKNKKSLPPLDCN